MFQALPHENVRVLAAGRPLQKARVAMAMVHGRGASAADILTVAAALDRPEVSYLAPEAEGNAWYPYPFTAPIEQNQPWLDDALGVVERVVGEVLNAGVDAGRLLLLGFSQGACLTLEYVARHPRRYAGVAALSGGLIGPPGLNLDHSGSFDQTPIFLGCSDVDPHIPKQRVLESAEALRRQGASVTVQLYPGMGHEVNEDELQQVRQLIDAASSL
jgi:phospholipase/carboxylesterase